MGRHLQGVVAGGNARLCALMNGLGGCAKSSGPDCLPKQCMVGVGQEDHCQERKAGWGQSWKRRLLPRVNQVRPTESKWPHCAGTVWQTK